MGDPCDAGLHDWAVVHDGYLCLRCGESYVARPWDDDDDEDDWDDVEDARDDDDEDEDEDEDDFGRDD
jgi:hypothetical protein